MTLKRWNVSHGRDGFKVDLYESEWWVLIAERFSDVVTAVTFHRICCKQPEWTWKVPIGRPKYDYNTPLEDGSPWLENSLGGVLWGLGQKISVLGSSGDKITRSIPIDKELGIVLWGNPEDSWLWEEKNETIE